jgi:vancomycin resistance protein YoaR
LARRDNHQRRILLKAKIVSVVVKLDIISINCPNKKEDKYDKKKDKKSVPKSKKYYKKGKNGQAYFVEWDSDASSDEDDDDKPSRGLAGVAIKEAPSLF